MNDEHLEAWIVDLPAAVRPMAEHILLQWKMGELGESIGAVATDANRFAALQERLRQRGIYDYSGNAAIQAELATLSPKVRVDAEEFLQNWEIAHFFGPGGPEDRATELKALRSWIKNPEHD